MAWTLTGLERMISTPKARLPGHLENLGRTVNGARMSRPEVNQQIHNTFLSEALNWITQLVRYMDRGKKKPINLSHSSRN